MVCTLVLVLNVNKHAFEQLNYGSGKDVSEETITDAKTGRELIKDMSYEEFTPWNAPWNFKIKPKKYSQSVA